MPEADGPSRQTEWRFDSRPGEVRAAREGAGRAPAFPGRSATLIAAMRRRFPGYPHAAAFDTWNKQQAQDDPRRLLTTRLFSDINRGHTPTPHHVSALAAATGWTFEQVSLALGIDFARIPRLHAAMGIDRTHVDEDGVAFSGSRDLPTELTPVVRPDLNAPLNELVMDWVHADAHLWTPDERYLTGQIGRDDNLAYPRLPSGAAVLIDRTRRDPTGDDRGHYAIEHPNGCSCSRVTVAHDLVRLLSERRDLYPALEYPADRVHVHGRVTAFAGRIDRMREPVGVGLSRLRDEQRPLLDRARRRGLPIQTLLRELVTRYGLTRSRFERKVHILQRLAGKEFKVSRSHMSGLMENTRLSPRLNTLYALAAMLLLDPLDLLQAYGVPVGPASFGSIYETPGLGGPHDPATRIGRVRMHETLEQLRHGGWDFSWLCALPRPAGQSQRLYYLGDPGPQLAPLITAPAFVIVNRRQRHVLTRLYGQPVAELSDWMRPIYLLQTNTQRRYLAGYVEDRGTVLDVIPHPQSPTRRIQRLRHPDEAVIVGRVTHVATLVD
jgi:transcriptional regulator with XRE-family HTH domain